VRPRHRRAPGSRARRGEHPLGVCSRSLQVDAQCRQASKDDPDPRLALNAERRRRRQSDDNGSASRERSSPVGAPLVVKERAQARSAVLSASSSRIRASRIRSPSDRGVMGSGSNSTPAMATREGRSKRARRATDCSIAPTRLQRDGTRVSSSSSASASRESSRCRSPISRWSVSQPAASARRPRSLRAQSSPFPQARDGPVRVQGVGVGDERVELASGFSHPRDTRG